MRSLALKLTLAFLIVGLTGVVLVAVFAGLQTQREFDQFVLNRYQLDLVAELANFYQVNGGWEGVEAFLFTPPRSQRPYRHGRGPAPVTLLDADRTVLVSGGPYEPGARLAPAEAGQAAPVEVNGATVGWVLFDDFGAGGPPSPDSPESQFLASVSRATLLSALAATAVALLLGVLLARTIARPARELTAATRAIAQGELGYQVPVYTQDELGALATSFNQMSTDLARANQLRRQMTADIAHDLRTPTSVIMGYTEALSDGKLPGTPEIYQTMHQEAQHLSHLIEDLRVLSLADAGELPLTPQAVLPLALLEQAAAAHSVQAHKDGIRLTIESAPDLAAIHVDPDRMAQVLGNLVSNALRYTPAGGRVTLSAGERDGQILLQVRDTGVGITAEDLPHVFRRFYRSDKSRSANGESGLGLAIARSIIEAHGGKITAESVLGKGTTFIITLPVLKEW